MNVIMSSNDAFSKINPEDLSFHHLYLNNTVPPLDDPARILVDKLEQFRKYFDFLEGKKVAVTCGSRRIASMVDLLSAIVTTLKRWGIKVFVVPAMGSHGGNSPRGQRKILEGLGVCEDTLECPVISSTSVDHIGTTDEGYSVYMDAAAHNADALVVFNRIKPHTIFCGEIESGLQKMFVVGLGNGTGAEEMHYHGELDGYSAVIQAIAGRMIRTVQKCIGVAVIENESHAVAGIEVMRAEDIPLREPELLKTAKRCGAKLAAGEVDLLLIDRIGKDISGTGMDMRLLGKVPGVPTEEDPPAVRRIMVRDLTAGSHGNANGIGMADIATGRIIDKVDWKVTYMNCLTSFSPMKGKHPVTASSDREALVWVIKTLPYRQLNSLRVLHIRDTSDITLSEASTGVVSMVDTTRYRIDGTSSHSWSFDGNGNLLSTIDSPPE
jgi:hypothetical protein